jgi:hypothetical protein
MDGCGRNEAESGFDRSELNGRLKITFIFARDDGGPRLDETRDGEKEVS